MPWALLQQAAELDVPAPKRVNPDGEPVRAARDLGLCLAEGDKRHVADPPSLGPGRSMLREQEDQ